jgi:hypothetical protein
MVSKRRSDAMDFVMSKPAKGTTEDMKLQHRTNPLCWAARLLALGYGLLIALYTLGVLILTLIGHVSRGETWGSALWLLTGLPFFVPLVLAVVAWRWHLLGGTLIAAGSVALYLFFALSGNMQWGVHLYVLPLLLGGLLHLLVWYKEKRTDHMPQPA